MQFVAAFLCGIALTLSFSEVVENHSAGGDVVGPLCVFAICVFAVGYLIFG